METSSQGPPSEHGPDHLLDDARDQVDAAEQAGASRVGRVLRRHPALSRVVDIVVGVLREQAVERVGLAASGAAFWLFISAFPTAIAAITLFGLVVSPQQVATDLGNLANGAPASLGSLVKDQLRRVAAGSRTGLSLGLATSLLVAIWSASAGTYNLDRAIRQAYGLPGQSYVEARGRALVGALVTVVMLGLSALVVSVVVRRSPAAVILIVGVPGALAALTAGIAVLYRFSVGGGMPVKALVPGALVSSIGVVAVIAGFSLYVAWSRRFTAVYGVFAGAVIGMIGTYLAVYAILLGAVLNAQLTAGARKRDTG